MKTYYAVQSKKGLKLKELPGNHIYTIHSTTYEGAEECLRMLQNAQKRIDSETLD